MPSTSKAQQSVMAMAEHNPKKLFPANRGVLKMSHDQLHDFASTPTRSLPAHSSGKKKKKLFQEG